MNKDSNDKDWYAQQLVSDNVPLIDPSEGRPIILKDFIFVMRPNFLIPTKQMLFNSHWDYMRKVLWSEGLEANEDHPPRVVVGKNIYHIFIVCEVRGGKARVGRMKDKAKNISEVLTKPKDSV